MGRATGRYAITRCPRPRASLLPRAGDGRTAVGISRTDPAATEGTSALGTRGDVKRLLSNRADERHVCALFAELKVFRLLRQAEQPKGEVERATREQASKIREVGDALVAAGLSRSTSKRGRLGLLEALPGPYSKAAIRVLASQQHHQADVGGSPAFTARQGQNPRIHRGKDCRTLRARQQTASHIFRPSLSMRSLQRAPGRARVSDDDGLSIIEFRTAVIAGRPTRRRDRR